MEYPIAKELEELNREKQEKFEELADNYSMLLQDINRFIENNELDYDTTWDAVNQHHDMAMSYAPNDD